MEDYNGYTIVYTGHAIKKFTIYSIVASGESVLIKSGLESTQDAKQVINKLGIKNGNTSL